MNREQARRWAEAGPSQDFAHDWKPTEIYRALRKLPDDPGTGEFVFVRRDGRLVAEVVEP